MSATIRVSVILILVAFLTGFSAADANLDNPFEKYFKRCDGSKPTGYTWANNWDGNMNFNCPNGQSISYMRSIYRGCRRDRIWTFSCQTTPAASSCSWTNFVNDWDLPLFFMCPHDGVISGMFSTHDNNKEDRRFKIKCCRNNGYSTYDCTTSAYLNNWNAVLNYNTPPSRVIVGLFSYHRNDKEDRVWKVQICRTWPE